MFLRAVLIAAAIAMAVGPTVIGSSSPASVQACSEDYYRAASGHCVHRPICGVPTQPPGGTALCADGCWSFSEHPDDDDTCHGHGGVA
jgi:Protein of unknown function (DUF3761)